MSNYTIIIQFTRRYFMSPMVVFKLGPLFTKMCLYYSPIFLPTLPMTLLFLFLNFSPLARAAVPQVLHYPSLLTV